MHENDVALVTFSDLTATGKCFWQADLFCGAAKWTDEDWADAVPDAFFTLKADPLLSASDAIARAKDKWPGCEVRYIASDDDEDWDD